MKLSEEQLGKFVGKYEGARNVELQLEEGCLMLLFQGREHDLVAINPSLFAFAMTDASVEFKLDKSGNAVGLEMNGMGDKATSTR